MSRYGLRVPRSMTTLSRALLTLEGTLKTIAAGFDIGGEAGAVLSDSGLAEQDVGGDVLRAELLRALPVLRNLPDHLDELATQLRGGRLSVQVERFGGSDRRRVDAWIDRVLAVAIGGCALVASAILLVAAGLARSTAVSDALKAVGFIGLVVGLVLLMRSLAQLLQRQEPPPEP
jgi:ubiquinone biosynthesis protein